MKFAFCGYDFFSSVLEALLTEGHELDALLSYEVDGKYNSNCKVLHLAKSLGVPIFLGKPSEAAVHRLLSSDCNIMISAAYPYRLPVLKNMIQVNLHQSPLPVGRGPWPLPYAVLKQLTEFGVTMHRIDGEFDSGPIISQQRFELALDETLETLSAKCRIAAKNLAIEFMKNPKGLWETALPQGAGSYWPFPTSADWHIEWSNSVEEIYRISRAFGKLESTCEIEGKRFVIRDLRVWKASHLCNVGTVVERSKTEIVIAAADGFVCLREFELDSSE